MWWIYFGTRSNHGKLQRSRLKLTWSRQGRFGEVVSCGIWVCGYTNKYGFSFADFRHYSH